jgi:tRNA1(Val) A37 N6-methylase TrmN6
MNDKAAVLTFLEALLLLSFPKEAVLFNLGKGMLGATTNPAALEFLNEYDYPEVQLPLWPQNEYDLLGTAYQFLNTKLENLERGSFYTGPALADDLVGDLSFDNGESILDPACGSGSLLFHSAASAGQITGIDNDPTAIMLAKFNYFIKFPDAPAPRLYASDYFAWHSLNCEARFTYVIGNPPYGATVNLRHSRSTSVTTGESFSHFIECGYELLANSGILRFLVPEALLNVKRHRDIRDFILTKSNLVLLKSYKAAFAGVMSDIYRIDLDKQNTPHVRFIATEATDIPKSLFLGLKNHIFSNLSQIDIQIIQKVQARCKHDLLGSTFGLGIVTGDNKTKLLAVQTHGSEPIYTGKEVERYELLPAQNFIVFDRSQLQQVAPDSIYRATEKLVYKTISKRLKVAIDRSGSLTSNSANIVLPCAPDNNIESIASLLNSDLYSFLNIKLFGGVNKVARENLEHLPVPAFNNSQLAHFVEMIRTFKVNDTALQHYVHRTIFDLTDYELVHIHGTVYGTDHRSIAADRKQDTHRGGRRAAGRPRPAQLGLFVDSGSDSSPMRLTQAESDLPLLRPPTRG